MDRDQEAIKDFSSAIELAPENKYIIKSRGNTYYFLERYEEALKDFDRAIEIDPEYIYAIVRRGKTYRSLKQYEEALKDFNHAIEIDPEDDWIRYNRAFLLLTQPHPFELAKTDLNTAISIAKERYSKNPENCQNVFNLALYHLVTASTTTAIELYQVAIQKVGSRSELEDAIQDLMDLLKVFPDHIDAREQKNMLENSLTALPN